MHRCCGIIPPFFITREIPIAAKEILPELPGDHYLDDLIQLISLEPSEYKMEYLFSYGTLQKEKVQIELFGRKLQGSPDSLRGHTLSTIEITDESFLAKGEDKYQQTLIISEDTNDIINGTVFQVTEEELFLADKYEPDGYKRVSVVLESGKAAWIYLVAGT